MNERERELHVMLTQVLLKLARLYQIGDCLGLVQVQALSREAIEELTEWQASRGFLGE